MQITINITTDKNNYITESQAEILRAELTRIVDRLTDPDFVPRTKKIVGADVLSGAVVFDSDLIAITHTIEEGIHEMPQ